MKKLPRRQFLKVLGASAASLPFVPVLYGGNKSKHPNRMLFMGCNHSTGVKDILAKRPNIVFIMVDDFGYECIRSNGGTSYQTPAIDNLAETGIRFEHCYATPLCTPTRVQLMTGQYNFRNYTEFGSLPPGQYTFGHLLQQAGYKTCVVGKWQLTGKVEGTKQRGEGTLPELAGFDEHCLWQVKVRGSRYWAPVIRQNGVMRDDVQDRFGPDVFVDYIEDFIGRHRSEPFFVYYPMALTHDPFVPTPDRNPEEEEKNTKSTANFPAMVAYVDKLVQRIVDILDKYGHRENTLIVFTGDNGTHKTIVSNLNGSEIQGAKGETKTAGTHVPLIANWPGIIPAAQVNKDLIDFTDFFPTIADVADTKLPDHITFDGRSFLPQLKGDSGNPRDWIFCHYNPRWGNRQQRRYVQNKKWKLYDDGRIYKISKDMDEANPLTIESLNDSDRLIIEQFQQVLERME